MVNLEMNSYSENLKDIEKNARDILRDIVIDSDQSDCIHILHQLAMVI